MDEFQDIDFGDSHIQEEKKKIPEPVNRVQKKYKSRNKKSSQPTITKITVSDPEKRGEGINTFIVYKIITNWSNNEVKKVERRYSDFKWVHEQLSSKIKGVIIPPIPSKDFLGRFWNSDFVEKRRRGLEFFLQQVNIHELLKSAKEFQTFLTADTPSLRLAMAEETEDRKWYSTLTELKDYYLAPTSYRDPTDEDKKCDDIAEYADSLLQIISALDSQVQALQKSQKDQSQSWFELGLSLNNLGAFQTKNGAGKSAEEQEEYSKIGDALGYLGQHADTTANILSEKVNVQETRDWSEPINRYKKLVIAIQQMMKGRKDLLSVLKREEGNSLALKTKLKSATGDQLNALQNDIAMADQRVACLDGQLTEVTARLFEEFEKFKKTKAEELKTLITSFGKIQAEYHNVLSGKWSSVLDCIKSNKYPSEKRRISTDMDFVDLNDV